MASAHHPERTAAPRSTSPLDQFGPVASVGLWVIALTVISLGVFRDPQHRSLDPLYRSAFDAWRESRSAYVGSGGVNYLPTFMVIYGPFEAMPQPWGQLLWRWLAATGFAHALWLLLGSMERPRLGRGYLLLTVATLPITLGAIQIGQANAWLGVALLYSAAGLALARPWLASAALAFGLAVKPLMIAAMGLAAVLRPHIAAPLAVATAVVLALPFLLAPAPFVASEYLASVANLTGSCLWVEEHRFADLNGIFRSLGLPIAPGFSAWLRGLAGVGFAILTLVAARHSARTGDRELAWLWWLAASAAYLMLFNPMTESNSYCLMGIPMALWAWRWLGAGEGAVTDPGTDRIAGPTGVILGWSTLGLVLVMGTASEVLRPWLGNSLDLWLLPAATIVFLVPTTVEALGLLPTRRDAAGTGRGVAHA